MHMIGNAGPSKIPQRQRETANSKRLELGLIDALSIGAPAGGRVTSHHLVALADSHIEHFVLCLGILVFDHFECPDASFRAHPPFCDVIVAHRNAHRRTVVIVPYAHPF